MGMTRCLVGAVLVVLATATVSCWRSDGSLNVTRPPRCADDSFERDRDQNGRADLVDPSFVDVSRALAIDIISEITPDQAHTLLGQFVPPDEPELWFSLALWYDEGRIFRRSGFECLGPFERRLEAPCPNNVTGSVRIRPAVSFAPAPEFLVLDTDFDAMEATGGAPLSSSCDSVLRVRVFINNDGDAEVGVTVEPL